jgi:hypothetical protein
MRRTLETRVRAEKKIASNFLISLNSFRPLDRGGVIFYYVVQLLFHWGNGTANAEAWCNFRRCRMAQQFNAQNGGNRRDVETEREQNVPEKDIDTTEQQSPSDYGSKDRKNTPMPRTEAE